MTQTFVTILLFVIMGQSNARNPYMQAEFKAHIEAQTGLQVILIDCAQGGSSITQWQKGDALYQNCIAQIENAPAPVAGVLWNQGERDSRNYSVAVHWRSLFEMMINDLRADIGNVPIVYSQLGPQNLFYSWELIRRQQEAVNLENAIMVNVDDILGQDYTYLHYRPYKAQLIGKRFANEMLSLLMV